jgi:hypothetical protein
MDANLPSQPLPLPNESRAPTLNEAVSSRSAEEAWKAIQSQLRVRPLHFGAIKIDRDELYDRH